MKLEDIRIRIDELILKCNQLISSQYRDQDGFERIDESRFMGLKTASLSLILKIYDKSHPFYKELERIQVYYYPSTAKGLLNVLISISEEVNGRWLFSTKGLVSSEIFADFIEMAEHLLNEGFKDPAAVMIGSVLEEHLRQLCIKNNLEIVITKSEKKTPKKADLLNSELSGANIYNKLDQKNVTAWLDLRNKAAHGQYSEYRKEQVEIMLAGVMDFLIKNPI